MSKRKMYSWARQGMRGDDAVKPWPRWAQVVLILVGLGLCALAYHNLIVGGG